MMQQKDIETKAGAVRVALQAKLGVGGRNLSQALRNAGRHLPRHVRAQGQVLVCASYMAGNPKLARRIDGAAVDAAYSDVIRHLKQIDVGDARKGRLLSLAGTIAFNLLFVAVAFVVFLWVRGYV